jgi:flagellar hook assembly protein FlgD
MGAVGQAATYHVTLLKPTVVAGQELKPGDYKVEVNNNTAVISHGKRSVETKVKTESADKKYDSTVIRYELDGAKYKLLEIGIGGSKTKLVLNEGGAAAGAL